MSTLCLCAWLKHPGLAQEDLLPIALIPPPPHQSGRAWQDLPLIALVPPPVMAQRGCLLMEVVGRPRPRLLPLWPLGIFLLYLSQSVKGYAAASSLK
jgi:hypothetical protein